MIMQSASAYALEIRNLRTVFPGPTGPLPIVDDVSLAVRPGELLAVVGESGSGKSMTFMSALGLIAKPGRVESGQVKVVVVEVDAVCPEAGEPFEGVDRVHRGTCRLTERVTAGIGDGPQAEGELVGWCGCGDAHVRSFGQVQSDVRSRSCA